MAKHKYVAEVVFEMTEPVTKTYIREMIKEMIDDRESSQHDIKKARVRSVDKD